MERVKITTNTRISKLNSIIYQVELLVDIDDAHKSGDLGGWVESIENLKNPITNEIEGVVLDEAEILQNAKVYDNAIVKDSTRVRGNAIICGNAIVGNDSRIIDDVIIDGNTLIEARCLASIDTRITNDVILTAECIFKGGIISESPLQINGSVTNILVHNNELFIGCEKHSLEHWEKNINKIGKDFNYTKEQIDEYKMHLNNAITKNKLKK